MKCFQLLGLSFLSAWQLCKVVPILTMVLPFPHPICRSDFCLDWVPKQKCYCTQVIPGLKKKKSLFVVPVAFHRPICIKVFLRCNIDGVSCWRRSGTSSSFIHQPACAVWMLAFSSTSNAWSKSAKEAKLSFIPLKLWVVKVCCKIMHAMQVFLYLIANKWKASVNSRWASCRIAEK